VVTRTVSIITAADPEAGTKPGVVHSARGNRENHAKVWVKGMTSANVGTGVTYCPVAEGSSVASRKHVQTLYRLPGPSVSDSPYTDLSVAATNVVDIQSWTMGMMLENREFQQPLKRRCLFVG